MATLDQMQRFFATIGKYARDTGYITGYKYEICYPGINRTNMSEDEVERIVHIPRNILAKVRGNNNRHIKDVVHKSGISTFRIVGDSDRDQESRRKQGHVPIIMNGKQKCLQTAVTMLENIIGKDNRMKERQKLLTELERRYNILIGGRIKLKSTLHKVPVNLKNLKRIAKIEDKLEAVEQELDSIKLKLNNARRRRF